MCVCVGQCVLAFIALYVLLAMVAACRRLRWSYLASVWNCLDALVVVLTWLSMLLFVVLLSHDATVQSKCCGADRSVYISYAQSAELQNVWRAVNALLLTLLLIIVRNFLLCCSIDVINDLVLSSLNRRSMTYTSLQKQTLLSERAKVKCEGHVANLLLARVNSSSYPLWRTEMSSS